MKQLLSFKECVLVAGTCVRTANAPQSSKIRRQELNPRPQVHLISTDSITVMAIALPRAAVQ